MSKKMLGFGLGGIILMLIAVIGFLMWKYTELRSNPEALAEDKTQQLVKDINKLYALPTDEQPTVAQVQDKAKLKDQAFFNKAENGDYILIYTKDKLAVLYRQKENKLINVGPINLQSNSDPKTNQTNP